MKDDAAKSAKLIYNPDRTGILQMKDDESKAIGQTNLLGRDPWSDVGLALDCMQIVMTEYTSKTLAKDDIKKRIAELKASLDPDADTGSEDADEDKDEKEEDEKEEDAIKEE